MKEAFNPGPSPEERSASAKKLRDLAIKEGEMLKGGGEYAIDENGAVSYQYSDKQIDQRDKAVREDRIKKFCEVQNRDFQLVGIDVSPEEIIILKELIWNKPNLRYIEDIDSTDEDTYQIKPTEWALREAFLRLPPTLVPAEQLLNLNEKSEYPSITIDNSLSLDEAIAQAHIDRTHNRIKDFSFEESAGGEFKPVLVRFGVGMNWSAAEEQLDKIGLRSATLRELLAFAAAYPDDPNLENPIYVPSVKAIIELKTRAPYIHLTSKDESRNPMFKDLGIQYVIDNHNDFHTTNVCLCTVKEASEKTD